MKDMSYNSRTLKKARELMAQELLELNQFQELRDMVSSHHAKASNSTASTNPRLARARIDRDTKADPTADRRVHFVDPPSAPPRARQAFLSTSPYQYLGHTYAPQYNPSPPPPPHHHALYYLDDTLYEEDEFVALTATAPSPRPDWPTCAICHRRHPASTCFVQSPDQAPSNWLPPSDDNVYLLYVTNCRKLKWDWDRITDRVVRREDGSYIRTKARDFMQSQAARLRAQDRPRQSTPHPRPHPPTPHTQDHRAEPPPPSLYPKPSSTTPRAASSGARSPTAATKRNMASNLALRQHLRSYDSCGDDEDPALYNLMLRAPGFNAMSSSQATVDDTAVALATTRAQARLDQQAALARPVVSQVLEGLPGDPSVSESRPLNSPKFKPPKRTRDKSSSPSTTSPANDPAAAPPAGQRRGRRRPTVARRGLPLPFVPQPVEGRQPPTQLPDAQRGGLPGCSLTGGPSLSLIVERISPW